MTKTSTRTLTMLAFLNLFSCLSQARAAGYQVLYAFGSVPADGSGPESLLTKDGLLFGTTVSGGTGSCGGGCGTLFSLTRKGEERIIYQFPNAADANPETLLFAFGKFYGQEAPGGFLPDTFFTITESGVEKRLYANKGNRQGSLFTSLIQSGDHLAGLSQDCYPFQNGEVFTLKKSAPDYPYRILYSFNYQDGACPDQLVDMNGTLYGATSAGGANGFGVVFSVSPTGVGTTLTSLSEKLSSLVVADGQLYAILSIGSANATFVNIDTSGNIHTIFTFPGSEEYFFPLTYRNGIFYGISTNYLFSVDTAGNYNVLHQFDADAVTQFSFVAPPAPVYLGGELYGPVSGSPTTNGYIWKYTP